MSSSRKFRTVNEIFRSLGERRIPPFGIKSYPIPVKTREALHVVVLCYREGPLRTPEILFPPHHKAVVDAATCELVEEGPCVPRDFGVAQSPKTPIEGFGIDPNLSADEYWRRVDRTKEIAPAVWELYDTGSTALGETSRALVREYDLCFRSTLKAPLLPYYEAVAKDFLDWVARVVA